MLWTKGHITSVKSLVPVKMVHSTLENSVAELATPSSEGLEILILQR